LNTETNTVNPNFFFLTFPNNVPHARQSAISIPSGIMFAGGITNVANYVESNVFFLDASVVKTKEVNTLPITINPTLATDILQVNLEATQPIFEIWDGLGRKYSCATHQTGADSWSIGVAQLPKASYYLRVQSEHQTGVKQFIRCE
jgi:hypothetical protein